MLASSSQQASWTTLEGMQAELCAAWLLHNHVRVMHQVTKSCALARRFNAKADDLMAYTRALLNEKFNADPVSCSRAMGSR